MRIHIVDANTNFYLDCDDAFVISNDGQVNEYANRKETELI